MSDWDEDDDDCPAEFPWLLWVPVIHGIVHCLLLGLVVNYILVTATYYVPLLIIFTLPAGLAAIYFCFNAIRGCVRIITGKAVRYSNLIGIFLGLGFSSGLITLSVFNSTSRLIWITETILFLVCFAIAYYCEQPWIHWKRERWGQNDDMMIYPGYRGGDHEGRHGIFNTPPN